MAMLLQNKKNTTMNPFVFFFTKTIERHINALIKEK